MFNVILEQIELLQKETKLKFSEKLKDKVKVTWEISNEEYLKILFICEKFNIEFEDYLSKHIEDLNLFNEYNSLNYIAKFKDWRIERLENNK